MVLTFTLNYGILMMKSLKQREQMADYNKDQMDRDERTGRRVLGQYDPQMRYVETLGQEDFPDNVRPKDTEELVKDLKDFANRQYDDITKPEHYCAGFQIEPLDYILKNGLDFLEGNIIKYVSRYDMKGGVKDLEKAKFYIDRLIEREKEKRDS
jgi:hypothetical protein